MRVSVWALMQKAKINDYCSYWRQCFYEALSTSRFNHSDFIQRALSPCTPLLVMPYQVLTLCSNIWLLSASFSVQLRTGSIVPLKLSLFTDLGLNMSGNELLHLFPEWTEKRKILQDRKSSILFKCLVASFMNLRRRFIFTNELWPVSPENNFSWLFKLKRWSSFRLCVALWCWLSRQGEYFNEVSFATIGQMLAGRVIF